MKTEIKNISTSYLLVWKKQEQWTSHTSLNIHLIVSTLKHQNQNSMSKNEAIISKGTAGISLG